MIKTNFLVFLGLLIAWQIGFAQVSDADLEYLNNTKEPLIGAFSKKDQLQTKLEFSNQNYNQSLKNSLYSSVKGFLNNDILGCELNLISRFNNVLKINHIEPSFERNEKFFKALRVNNDIDDIVYKIFSNLNKDFYSLKDIDQKFHIQDTQSDHLFASWPDEKNECLYPTFFEYLKNVKLSDKTPKSKKLKALKAFNINAYKEQRISKNTFKKLEYLRKKSLVIRGNFWLYKYFNSLTKVKDVLLPKTYREDIPNLAKEDDYSVEKLKRLKKITRREYLYAKYDSDQIYQLAEILVKASRRMGTDPDVVAMIPKIEQVFYITNENGEKENYVETLELDSQQQYNYARKRMRKDIHDLQVSKSFVGVDIYYSEIVVAALETGYITFEDLNTVVSYDDLWNPVKTKFERMVNFVFSVANIGTFFIPPPFNIAGSIALSVVEGVVSSKHPNGAENENPATIID